MRVLKTTAYKILHINRGQIRQTLQQLVSNQESSHLHKRWQKFNDHHRRPESWHSQEQDLSTILATYALPLSRNMYLPKNFLS